MFHVSPGLSSLQLVILSRRKPLLRFHRIGIPLQIALVRPKGAVRNCRESTFPSPRKLQLTITILTKFYGGAIRQALSGRELCRNSAVDDSDPASENSPVTYCAESRAQQYWDGYPLLE
jgi:hypothetical protein